MVQLNQHMRHYDLYFNVAPCALLCHVDSRVVAKAFRPVSSPQPNSFRLIPGRAELEGDELVLLPSSAPRWESRFSRSFHSSPS